MQHMEYLRPQTESVSDQHHSLLAESRSFHLRPKGNQEMTPTEEDCPRCGGTGKIFVGEDQKFYVGMGVGIALGMVIILLILFVVNHR
jgi:hypothetical protein